MARSHNFPPTVISSRVDLLLNLARRQELGRAEPLMSAIQQAVAETGNWHRWLWNIRLGEAQAEVALARGDLAEAGRRAEETIALSRAKGRLKYEILGLWTRGRALAALGQTQAAVTELQIALTKARQLGDPALLLRIHAAFLPIDGSDALAAEARANVQQITAHLSDSTLRQRFEDAEPVRLIKKLAA
jgi:hypothetical protein